MSPRVHVPDAENQVLETGETGSGVLLPPGRESLASSQQATVDHLALDRIEPGMRAKVRTMETLAGKAS